MLTAVPPAHHDSLEDFNLFQMVLMGGNCFNAGLVNLTISFHPVNSNIENTFGKFYHRGRAVEIILLLLVRPQHLV